MGKTAEPDIPVEIISTPCLTIFPTGSTTSKDSRQTERALPVSSAWDSLSNENDSEDFATSAIPQNELWSSIQKNHSIQREKQKQLNEIEAQRKRELKQIEEERVKKDEEMRVKLQSEKEQEKEEERLSQIRAEEDIEKAKETARKLREEKLKACGDDAVLDFELDSLGISCAPFSNHIRMSEQDISHLRSSITSLEHTGS
uniref:Uncharacterized protein n=1 Tax=Vannella robusta TaxID=1487602 RepID=A0A7S4HXU4_9EUKA|mmetsp:Transcript_17327/g.22059  ORF Transcript_17327/g.22059 Transcript_17327/m.22059 type:complete len:201 (+) Transcript_17327:370-972(+)